jgi:hypothetical protein
VGEYEDRYPDAYGRDETAGQPPAEADLTLPPRQHRQSTLFNDNRVGADVAAETAPAWQHAPSDRTLPADPAQLSLIEPAGRLEQSYRGLGPRG